MFKFREWNHVLCIILITSVNQSLCAPGINYFTYPASGLPDEGLTYTQMQVNRNGDAINSISMTTKLWGDAWPQPQQRQSPPTLGFPSFPGSSGNNHHNQENNFAGLGHFDWNSRDPFRQKQNSVSSLHEPSIMTITTNGLKPNNGLIPQFDQFHQSVGSIGGDGGFVQTSPISNPQWVGVGAGNIVTFQTNSAPLCPGFPFCGNTGPKFCPGFPFCGNTGPLFCPGFPFCRATAKETNPVSAVANSPMFPFQFPPQPVNTPLNFIGNVFKAVG